MEMGWKKVLFVYNPVAGKSQIRSGLSDVIETLSAAGFQVVVYPTRGRGDARKLLRMRREDYLYVVCAGGDGTLDEVVSGMMENPEKPFVPIGYIPAGTTNDFAASLHIPMDLKEAAKVVTGGRVFRCDMGVFNRREYFTYVAAFGIFTGASYQTSQELKNQFGHFAYILQGMTELGQMRAYQMHVTAYVQSRVESDGENDEKPAAGSRAQSGKKRGAKSDGLSIVADIQGEFAFGMVTNSRSIGGFANITGPRVDLQDGLLELTLVRMPKNPLELSEILMSIGNPDLHSEMLSSFQASKVTLECMEKVAWTRDGEYAGTHKKVVIENCPGQLRILVPQEYADAPV